MLTDEGYTEGLLEASEDRNLQYQRLAEARYRRYSGALGKRTFRLLEIGCGSCGLARTYEHLGVEYHGIDLDPRVVAAARAANVERVQNLDFFEFSSTARFDVIAFSQVLEHIKEPGPFIAKVHSMLEPGGVLHCDVPDHDSLPSLIHRLPLRPTRWGAIAYPHHLFAYSHRSLRALCERGFSVEVFNATVTDPVWGQVTARKSLLARASPVLKRFNAGSILVAWGTKK